MKYLKNFFSFIVLLTSMLIAYSLYLNINKTVSNYEKEVTNDYSIVVVSSSSLDKEDINTVAGIGVSSIQTLDSSTITQKFERQLTKNSLEFLEKNLPFFYKIYLERFPAASELEIIQQELSKYKDVLSVETFSKNHTTTYLLLTLVKNITVLLFFIILIFVILILTKEIKLWFYEHDERLSIMKLHGASTLYSAKPIIKTAMLSSLLAYGIALLILFLVSINIDFIILPELKDILVIDFLAQDDLVQMFIMSVGVCFMTIIGVLFKHKFH